MTNPERLSLVAEAGRAPSAHNTQPARWRFTDDAGVELHVDPTRTLPVSDPSGHDLQIALGAAWEGLSLALGRRGRKLVLARGNPPETPARGRESVATPDRPAASGRIASGGPVDPLVAAVGHRATWRGRFQRAAAVERQRLAASLAEAADPGGHLLVEDPAMIGWIAERADQASLAALRRAPYFRELTRWMRFTRRHPGWSRDGLNADAMHLSSLERAAAGWAARPSAHGFLRASGLLALFAAEASRTRTASVALILLAPREEPPFATGRRFYRMWLAACRAGWALCPMSALADDDAANAEVRDRCAVPPAMRIVNVLRLGIPPPAAAGWLTPRLPAAELLIP